MTRFIFKHPELCLRAICIPVALGSFIRANGTDSIFLAFAWFILALVFLGVSTIRITTEWTKPRLLMLLNLTLSWTFMGLLAGVVISRMITKASAFETSIFFVFLVLSIIYLHEAWDNYGSARSEL